MGGRMSHLTVIPATSLRVKDWSDYGELHRVVMSLFNSTQLPGPATEKRLSRNILFRVDEGTAGKILLVRADVAPTNLPSAAKTKEVAVSAPAIDTPVRFRLTVNAIRRTMPSGPTVKRGHGTSPVDHMAEWVSAKLEPGLGDVTIFDHVRSVASSGRSPLQLDIVDGYGIVKDVAALETLLQTGIGRSKAFGCGLLTIARA